MKVVIQRVSQANVIIDDKEKAKIGNGLLLLLGIEHEDTIQDVEWLVKKVSQLRIFNDDQGIMNLSVTAIKGEFLVISQFTLHASTKKGNRPSYIRAARPETAIPLYNDFIRQLKVTTSLNVSTGEFGADMKIGLVNDGPVTIIIDSKKRE